MIKLKQLLSELNYIYLTGHTPDSIKERAKDVRSRLITITRFGKYVYESVTTKNGNRYRQYIFPKNNVKNLDVLRKERLYKTSFHSPDDDVFVQCTCPYFRYHLEVALHKRDTAKEIAISNGQFPKIRNPKLIPYACKHLISAFQLFDKQTDKYNKVKERRLIKFQQQQQSKEDAEKREKETLLRKQQLLKQQKQKERQNKTNQK